MHTTLPSKLSTLCTNGSGDTPSILSGMRLFTYGIHFRTGGVRRNTRSQHEPCPRHNYTHKQTFKRKLVEFTFLSIPIIDYSDRSLTRHKHKHKPKKKGSKLFPVCLCPKIETLTGHKHTGFPQKSCVFTQELHLYTQDCPKIGQSCVYKCNSCVFTQERFRTSILYSETNRTFFFKSTTLIQRQIDISFARINIYSPVLC